MKTHEEIMIFLEPEPSLDIQDIIKRATNPLHPLQCETTEKQIRQS